MNYNLNIHQIEMLLLAALGAGSDRSYADCEAIAKKVAGAFADTGSLTRQMIDNAATSSNGKVMYCNADELNNVTNRGRNLMTVCAAPVPHYTKRMLLTELPE